MPAISPGILDTVVYLYPDQESAQRGERAGGSGCIVAMPLPTDPLFAFSYIVTNSHVIREGRASAVRFNTRDGGMGLIHSTHNGWIHHPNGDDVAILPIVFEYGMVKAKGIPVDMFVTEEKLTEYQIGPGDEAFMVGRFINHEGKQQNLPAARFGNLAMLPHEKVRHPRGILQEAFLVECRSLPGYSGSPVFLHPLPFNTFPRKSPPPMFLGIDVGSISDSRPVLDKKEWKGGKRVEIDNYIVEANTGMAYVVPAWKILELLNVGELVKSRQEVLAELEKEMSRSPMTMDVATPEERTFTEEDFERALKQVSRRVDSSESDAGTK